MYELVLVVHETHLTQFVGLFCRHLVHTRVAHHRQERRHVVGVQLLASEAFFLGALLLQVHTHVLYHSSIHNWPIGLKEIIMPHQIIGTLAVNLWAVTFGTATTGLGGAATCPGPSVLYQM